MPDHVHLFVADRTAHRGAPTPGQPAQGALSLSCPPGSGSPRSGAGCRPCGAGKYLIHGSGGPRLRRPRCAATSTAAEGAAERCVACVRVPALPNPLPGRALVETLDTHRHLYNHSLAERELGLGDGAGRRHLRAAVGHPQDATGHREYLPGPDQLLRLPAHPEARGPGVRRLLPPGEGNGERPGIRASRGGVASTPSSPPTRWLRFFGPSCTSSTSAGSRSSSTAPPRARSSRSR